MDALREAGLCHLQFGTQGEKVGRWRAFLAAYQVRADYPDDAHAWLSCTLALAGVASGNFGVGGLLVDEAGAVVIQGHNQVFQPHFRSDRHAEMVVLDAWEDGHPEAQGRGNFTLVTSLEPCPMCLVRLSSCPAVRRVLFVAPDLVGGMVQRLAALPPSWLELSRGKSFVQARCSAELIAAAADIFQINLVELLERMR
jgi:cytosine deaminase